MPTEPRLEDYLAKLDRALGAVPVGDRADIITEIKSHALEAAEREQGRDMGQILAALGEPEAVANRYLMERGLKPGKPPRAPMMKWLTIGFLGTFGLCMLFALVVLWKFTPIVKIDEKAGRVTLLGGAIDINAEEGSIVAGGKLISDGLVQREVSGSKKLDPKAHQSLLVEFGNGKAELRTASDSTVRWECKVGGPGSEQPSGSFFSAQGREAKLDFSKVSAKCRLDLPKAIRAEVIGANGKFELHEIESPISVQLGNGSVGIKPNSGLQYKYDLQVTNGRIAQFESSMASNAIPIQVKLVNGKISRERHVIKIGEDENGFRIRGTIDTNEYDEPMDKDVRNNR